jgi:hypothetical protein
LINGLNLNTTALYIQSLQACRAHTPCPTARSSAEPPTVTPHQSNNAYNLPSINALVCLHHAPLLAIQSHLPGLPPSRQVTNLPSLASPSAMQCNTVPPWMPPSNATASKRAKVYAPPSPNIRNLQINSPYSPSQPNDLLMHQAVTQPYPSPTSSTPQKCCSPDSTPTTQAGFPSEHGVATNTSQLPTTSSPMSSYVCYTPTKLMHIASSPTTPSCNASPVTKHDLTMDLQILNSLVFILAGAVCNIWEFVPGTNLPCVGLYLISTVT